MSMCFLAVCCSSAYSLGEDDEKIYIGSASNLLRRFIQHRARVKVDNKACSIFYNSVRKYGWNPKVHFIFGILEYIKLHPRDGNVKIEKKKEIVLKREQYDLRILIYYYLLLTLIKLPDQC
jgi:hypothetical protein